MNDHRIIRELIAGLRHMQQVCAELEIDAEEAFRESQDRHRYAVGVDMRARAEHRHAVRERQEMTDRLRDAEFRDRARASAAHDLERARFFGDRYGEERAIKKIRRGW